ncbi:MAG: 5-(carboxyamino)imidazole ribonucleotide synthase [Deltaproteobacteria bacterium]|nr:5-(carboxyamino)imidazole ribonucleotide synthase [Deltaproteobacteria bacterium]
MSDLRPLGPGATVGVLGGGQLARMMALEARHLGLRVIVLDPNPRCGAAQVADGLVLGHFSDAEAACRLAAQVDVVTLDTEHVPAEVLRAVEAVAPCAPGSEALALIQDRLAQRRLLHALRLPQTRWAEVHDEASLRAGLAEVGLPAVLKTRRGGYDGKGQARIQREDHLLAAWASLGQAPCIIEAYVPFDREVSAVMARAADGSTRHWPLAENDHRRHVLHTTLTPARAEPSVGPRARALAEAVAARLDHVGVLCLELFLLSDGQLLVNEIAPRVHNSGHTSLGASVTSQFEQHLRAVCGLPLGDTTQARPAVMLNLLGDLWRDGPPPLERVFAVPHAKLHLYGKDEARPGRKVGHVLLLGDDPARLLDEAEALYRALGGK